MEHHASTLIIPFLIFTGAAVMATFALYARQAMLVAYIILGLLLGPALFKVVDGGEEAMHIASDIGIVLLLFLLGLDLSPIKLIKVVRAIATPTLASCVVFSLPGIAIGYILGFDAVSIMILAIAMMFSSTIIGIKLLPTTVLHHKPTGEIIISILLLQDLIAILIILGLGLFYSGGSDFHISVPFIKLLLLPVMVGLAYLLQKYLLVGLLMRFDKIKEYVFLLMIGWCFGIAQLTAWLGLSYEIGAFIAGVLMATHPIAIYVADSLKPLRDFFMVIFFFTLGSSIAPGSVGRIWVPALILAGVLLILKPLVFEWLLSRAGEEKTRAREVGFRLGQGSEFSLLIIALATQLGIAEKPAIDLIKTTMLITFMVSPYLIIAKYPTPVAIDDRLRRD